MSDQLKTFLRSLLCQLVDYRMQPLDQRGQYQDWSKWGRIAGRIDLASELRLITPNQWLDLHRLLSSASGCLGEPFPHPANVGPVIPWRVLHERRQLAALEAKPRVIYMGGYDIVDADYAKPPVQVAEPFVDDSEYLESCPTCEGNGEVDGWPCVRCSGSARVPADVKPQARDSANEKPQPVPAPAAPRELRLLCVLDILSPIDCPRYIPAGTMHRLSPRASVQGRWSLDGDAFYQLRSAHPKRPTAKVLVRCERHRQANAVCSIARTI